MQNRQTADTSSSPESDVRLGLGKESTLVRVRKEVFV